MLPVVTPETIETFFRDWTQGANRVEDTLAIIRSHNPDLLEYFSGIEESDSVGTMSLTWALLSAQAEVDDIRRVYGDEGGELGRIISPLFDIVDQLRQIVGVLLEAMPESEFRRHQLNEFRIASRGIELAKEKVKEIIGDELQH